MRSCGIEVVVPDMRENCLFVRQRKVDGLVWILVAHLFSSLIVTVDYLSGDGESTCLDAKELVKETLVVLVDTERTDHIYISIKHYKTVDFSVIILLVLDLVNIECVFLYSLNNLSGYLT